MKKTFQTSQKTNKQNEECKLLSTFMLKNEVDILDCSIENFTSESTIRREVHELEKEINKNGIPSEVIPAKVFAYSNISSVDPNAYISGSKNI